jgi:hydroxyethylthiazole kinase-like uncharacterized protein yjeF
MRLPTLLLRRKANSHKGDFGHVLIIAGSRNYSGAALLCSLAAMRSGAGLVTLGVPESLSNAVIKMKPKEVMLLPLRETANAALSLSAYKKIKDFSAKADVVVLGPGLSQGKSTLSLARKLISQINKPAVLDADALNALAGHLNYLTTKNADLITRILTPHPREMSRLTGKSVSYIQSHRKDVAIKFAKDYKVILVLKGHNTIVADYKGGVYINKTGNPGMSTAGCGDVLTGMIGAFVGQGLSGFNAAKYAVYLHGLAGDLAAKEKTQISLIASDIIDKIPQAIKCCS